MLLYVVAAEAAKSLPHYRIEGPRREIGPAGISTRQIGVSH